MPYFILLLFTFYSPNLNAQFVDDVPQAFVNLSHQAKMVYAGKRPKNFPRGGHLQGIQVVQQNEEMRYLFSGSSNQLSYLLLATPSQISQVIPLFSSPFRHAGGSQLSGNRFYTGVEDNLGKSQSVLISMGIDHLDTLHHLLRKGMVKRATAGAVAALDSMVLVGDWDSQNLDVYRINASGVSLEYTLSLKEQPHGSYQSLNLLTDSSGRIYLMGFYREGKNNRADLYQMLNREIRLLQKRTFRCPPKFSFRYGAGIFIDSNRILHLLTTTRKAEKTLRLVQF